MASTDRRGAETFAVHLVDALGPEARIAALAGSNHHTRHDVPVLPGRTLLGRWRSLRAAIERFDVVVAHGSTTLQACAIGLAGTGTPFVYRSIGDPSWWIGRSRLRRCRTAALMHRAARVVALWPEAADSLVGRFGLPPERIDVIPNAVPIAKFTDGMPRRSESRERFGLRADVPVVAYAGSLSPEKHPGAIIEAIARCDGMYLLVAGDGPLRQSLEAYARKALGSRAVFLGSVSDIRAVYAAADVLALASRTEGIPAVVIEAGLAGIPAVATEVGGLPDVIVDDVTGLLVESPDPRDLSSRIAEAIRRRDELGSAARRRYRERYDMAAVAEQWVVTMEKAISGA